MSVIRRVTGAARGLRGQQPPRDHVEGAPPADAEQLVVVGSEVRLDVADVLARALRHERVHHPLVVGSAAFRQAHMASHSSMNLSKCSKA